MMQKIICPLWMILTLAFTISSNGANAQKYFTKNAHIGFFSDTPIEKIEAHNTSSNCVFDLATGRIEFSALIKGFQFERALMQEHFNENYLESDKFPKAVFKGQIDNYRKIDPAKNTKHIVRVSGDLTMHGVTKSLSTQAVIDVKDGNMKTSSEFQIAVADFQVEIPSLVKDQIAKNVKVKVEADLKPLGK